MRRASASTTVLLGIWCIATGVSCDRGVGATRANVIVVVVDTLRADHLGSYGYAPPTSPNLDRFAARATRFANARAASSWTLPSVASILTGLYPAVHGAEQSDSVLSDDLDTMAEGFHDAGYETVAFSANPAFVTPRQGLARGFDRFDVLHGPTAEKRARGAVPADASLNTWVLEATADKVTSTALEWLGSRTADKPFFLYVHYFDPHAAYTPPAQYSRLFHVDPDAALAGDAQWPFLLDANAPPPDVLKTLVALYDAEIAATDAALGRLLDSLSTTTRDSTIVVVTADHGEEFGDHGGVQHGRTLYDELIRVPLLIAGPTIPEGKVVETPVSLSGLWATLSELTRTPVPPGAGIEPSFEPAMRHEPDGASAVYADLESRFEGDRLRHRRALVEGAWKLLLDPVRGAELFDVGSDPGERSDSGEQADRRDRMRTKIIDRDAAAVAKRATAPPRRAVLDAAKREQLKALGYLQ